MSTELFLWPYDDGEPSSVPFSKLVEAFSDLRIQESPLHEGERRVTDSEGRFICDIWVGDVAEMDDSVKGVTVKDPSKNVALWKSVFNYLSSGNIVLVWPGGGKLFAAAANQETTKHIPDDLVAELGGVAVVESAEALLKAAASA